jgi:tetratricopeptide (TPR) repeat protein
MSEAQGFGARWRELRRHPAVQAAAVYIGASWALIQVADIFVPDERIVRGLGIVLAVGFVAVVGAAWWTARSGAIAGAIATDSPVTSTPPRRRRRRYTYAAAALLLAVGGVFWWIRPNILGAVEPDAQVIAVLPFNASGPGVEDLGEGMVDLLSTNLDAVGGIRTVASRTVLHRWRQRAVDGSLDLEGSLAVGRDLEAGSVLLGSVVSVGPEVRLTAELYSVRGLELAEARAQGPADSVLALVDDLGVSLLREIWLAREPLPNLRVSGITTSNVDAIRAYLKGQQHYRRSEWDSAFAAFQEAIEADSTFALAHYGLGQVYGWNIELGGFGSEGARRHGELALRYSDHLPGRERTIVVANTLFEDGQVAAHDSMRRYVNRFPDDPEGWYLLGDIRYHAQPILGLDLEDLIGPFERALELDPSLVPALVHPLELSLAFDDSARYNRHLATLRSNAPAEHVRQFELAGGMWGDPDTVVQQLPTMGGRDGNLNDELSGNLYRSRSLHPAMVLPLLEMGASFSETGSAQWKELTVIRAVILASLGRLAEARPLFDSLWALAGPREAVAYSGLEPVAAGLADPSYAPGPAEQLFILPTDPEARQVVLYRAMLFELSQGRAAEARRLGEEALAADSAPQFDFLPALIEAGFGWADIIEGDTVGGLQRLRSALVEAGYARGPVLEWSQQLRVGLTATLTAYPETRAEGIRRLRYAQTPGETVYHGLRYLALGQALEAEGDAAGAIEAYSQFVRLWEKADPELQPRVETARRALERLGGEARD